MKFWKVITAATIVVASSNANAALIERLGGLAYYDDVANLTWLADANYAQTSGYDADGRMTWDQASTWAAGLNIGGVDGWRLANTVDVGNDGVTYTDVYQGVDSGYNITAHSELSNMFYNVLGNTAYYDTSGTSLRGYGLSNTGPFSNLQSSYYWSATEYAYDTNDAWYFFMDGGFQTHSSKPSNFYAWAVQSGDISAVPVPAATWLFASGLIGLIGLARRKC